MFQLADALSPADKICGRAAIKMLKGILAGVAGTVAVIILSGFLLLESGYIPANADANPGQAEVWAARTSLNATLRRESPKTENPIPVNDANLIQGVTLYAQNCATCHGTAKGAASESAIAKGMYPKPPQLASDGVEDDPEGVSFWKLQHGIRLSGMPSWKDALTDQQMWTLALFLKHMDKLPPAADTAWQKVTN